VSQYKYLTNFEKGKLLALTRDQMMMSRGEQMAQRLSLDPVCLAQLENGHRAVDEWHLTRGKELVREFQRIYS
jgi:hypothetical protein